MRKGMVFWLVLGCFWQAFATDWRDNRYAPGQLLVKFREGVLPIEQAWVRHIVGAQVLDVKSGLGIELWQVSPFVDVPALCQQLLRSGWVEIADPNWELQLADWTPNDPLYPQQPALPHIGCPQAWAYWRGSNQFIVAVLDTGVQLNHPDLQAKLLPGYDFGNDDNDPSDFHGHGTFVTGIAGAVTNNGTGVACIAPEGRTLPVKVFTNAGQGYLSDLIDGVNYARMQGAHVINLSLGSINPMPSFETTLNTAWNAGVVIVAAAGNTNSTDPFYPAYYPVCIAVAASNLDDTRSSVSTYGSWVDVTAPSGDVYSTTMPSGYGRNTGGFTSYSAPMVAAQALLLYPLVADGPADRSLARAQAVRNLIESTAVPVPGNYVARGRIDIHASVMAALTVPISGRITINGFTGSYNGRLVEVHLRPLNGNTVLATATTTANSTGNYSVSFFNYLGYYDLAIRAQGTLLRRVANRRVRYPGLTNVNVTLIPGDIDGNNVIDDADLLAVLFAFGQSGSNLPTDLNGDGVVDDADLLLVLFNFGQRGE
ncbi:MAG: S8 family serine peptidase [Armatimonadota bacterium]